VDPYSPAGPLSAADVSQARSRFADVQVWDRRVLEARMRDLVTETPYFRPQKPTVDTVLQDGRRRLTVGSARELDLSRAGGDSGSWAKDRLAYTHGLGLPGSRRPTSFRPVSRACWTRRWHRPAAHLLRRPPCEFAGLGPRGHAPPRGRRARLRSWIPLHRPGRNRFSGLERAVFALAVGNRKLLISHDVTHQSRILLHRDVRDRLSTLAPFIHWDAHPAALAVDGRIVYMVDGYTTSASYRTRSASRSAGPRSATRARRCGRPSMRSRARWRCT
jgi:uncharacterized membrane protein (UPF0182 family)